MFKNRRRNEQQAAMKAKAAALRTAAPRLPR